MVGRPAQSTTARAEPSGAPPPEAAESQNSRTASGNIQALLTRNRALRNEVQYNLFEAKGQATDDKFLHRPHVEDPILRRRTAVQNLRAKIRSETDGVDHFISQVREAVEELKLTFLKTQHSLRVAEARSELRSRRPPEENVEDALHEALEEEQRILIECLHLLSDKIQMGEDLVAPLQDTRFEMHQSRITLHLDKSGRPQELLDKLKCIEKTATEFSREAAKAIESTLRRTERVGSRTRLRMQQQIAALSDVKAQLEKDLKETTSIIRATQTHLEKTRRQLERAAPEKSLSDDCDLPKKKPAKQQLSAHVQQITAKVKAAAYTGFNGCSIDTVFTRFDRDGSGELDIEEVRRSFRRTCRIPPSLVSDADIAALCTSLDHDKSGSVSISEIVELLTSDEDVAMLEDRCRRAEDFLEKLRAAQQQSLADFRSKFEALRIDTECSKVAIAKGALKLEGGPTWRSRPSSSRMPAMAQPAPVPPLSDAPLERPNTSSMASKATQRTYLPSTARPITSSAATSPRKHQHQRALTDRTDRSELPKLEQSATPAARKLDSQTLDHIRSRIKAAAYTGTASSQLDVVFGRLDKDGSGRLSAEELRIALRRALRIPASSVSDSDVFSLFAMLDADSTGSVSVEELVGFVGSEVPKKASS
mmetsp:Transcript_72478/g.136894  ORF Transcript_72478/g.136894 Transcript_72478/m.136894 type:complete len:650 (+) Transcript_72478:99-2048(+)